MKRIIKDLKRLARDLKDFCWPIVIEFILIPWYIGEAVDCNTEKLIGTMRTWRDKRAAVEFPECVLKQRNIISVDFRRVGA